jgi:LacI family transcriptional regulator
MSVTLRDVAAEAGVSITTASFVLNGRAQERAISAPTDLRVRTAATALGYTANPQAKSLRTRRTHCIGLIAALPLDTFSGRIIEGVTTACRAKGFRCVLATIHPDDDPVQEAAAVVGHASADGLLVIDRGLDFPADRLAALLADDRPAVVAGRRADGAHCACDDHADSGRLGTEHLYASGRTDILYVGIAEDAGFGAFMAGARRAAAAAGRAVPDDRCVEVQQREYPLLRLDAAELLHLLLRKSVRPDAIFAYGDKLTLGVHRALIRVGVDMPEEVALLGYGDYENMFAALTPSVSAVRPPLCAIGRAAADCLLQQLACPRTRHDAAVAPLVVAGDIIGRAST